ncbi:hypothetical protein DQ04_23781000 [Trypanosoma grayi]|uniref:hypothetical protein n=1 Tax=Trypanosoma grayi TaxID=71804 RepID=UPI0004F48DA8|nr:hypothetical protein DQ04_23781000 [Trypanosoma grayi]KEG05305.1 hypothetical protein DQ04_23781000 [Trypanosoma grayi]
MALQPLLLQHARENAAGIVRPRRTCWARHVFLPELLLRGSEHEVANPRVVEASKDAARRILRLQPVRRLRPPQRVEVRLPSMLIRVQPLLAPQKLLHGRLVLLLLLKVVAALGLQVEEQRLRLVVQIVVHHRRIFW